jgi:hypothetical protein
MLFQVIFVPLCLLAAYYSIFPASGRQVSFRHRLVWFALFLAAGVMIAVPRMTTLAASYMGIGRGSDLVMYLGLIAGAFITRHFYVRFRQLEDMLTQVIRLDAIAKAAKGGSD